MAAIQHVKYDVGSGREDSSFQQKKSTWDIFEIQTANNAAENFDFNFRINKIFSYLPSFGNFGSTEFMSAFASFSNTKYFNVSISSILNRLSSLRLYQKFVQIGNAQNLGRGFI